MFKNVFKAVFGDPNQKEINKLTPLVDEINALEVEMKAKSDDEIRQMMIEFRQELRSNSAEQRAEVENLQQQVTNARA